MLFVFVTGAILAALVHLSQPFRFYLLATSAVGLPGLSLWLLRERGEDSLKIQEIAIFLSLGLCLWLLVSMVGLMLKLRLVWVIVGMLVVSGGLLLGVVIKVVRGSDKKRALLCLPCLSSVEKFIVVLAIGAALITLLTPRNSDDWYYLAYIADYVDGKPMLSEEPIADMGNPPSPRALYGAWWVVEASLGRMAGIEPARCHQVYLPPLIVAFGVLGIYSLAREIFRSDHSAALATCFQVLFFLSAIFPVNNIGWVFFCRTVQDKAACFALLVPIGIVLGLRLLRAERESSPGFRSLLLIYLLVASSTSLIHPLGVAWCALGIVPFALIEFIGRRVSAKSLVLIVMPFIVCSLIVLGGRGSTVASLKVEQYRSQLAWGEWVNEQPDIYIYQAAASLPIYAACQRS